MLNNDPWEDTPANRRRWYAARNKAFGIGDKVTMPQGMTGTIIATYGTRLKSADIEVVTPEETTLWHLPFADLEQVEA